MLNEIRILIVIRLKEYERVKIISDCFKNATEIDRVPRIYRPTRECDFACQAAKHYVKLHGYVLHLWEILKDKYKNFNLDETLRQVQEFFKNLVRRVNQFGTDVQLNLKKLPRPEHPKYVTPLPELTEIVDESES
ncbi:hypothetical protein KIN20_001103 [Parelaphostrongylus tenuis]|uniref:Uncharacterized protein n=1 Tax=Parelaphostrongylus tenuis TaxID=148309 RepID=A0AAD5LVP0_PARTN|nr:hypothetical protein KIN20_001103 [Parelaphostrongylus tenuis]